MVLIIALFILFLSHFSAAHVLLEKSTNDFADAVVAVEKNAASNAKFKCNSQLDRVHWTKNGRRIPCSKGGCRPTLKLTHLTPENEGLYQCWVPPGLPTNPSYALRVLDLQVVVGVTGRPEVEGPGNQSAPLGASVTLRCSVVSGLPPNIQWLRLLPEGTAEGPLRPRKVLEYEGANYEVLTPMSRAAPRSNNTWITKLNLNKLNEHSSGYYVCVATNNHGYDYKGGFVTVTQKAYVSGIAGGGRSEVLYIEVVLIATVFMLIATTALALLYLAHWNRRHYHHSPTNL